MPLPPAQRPGSRPPRTPLLAELRRLFRLAALANAPGAPPPDELVEIDQAAAVSRRACLRAAALAGSGAVGASAARRASAAPRPIRSAGNVHTPRIVVVGAGVAGLNATYRLKLAGHRATLYSADERVGGRIATAPGLLAPGVTTELGGEFIDTGHADMRELIRHFGLPTHDFSTDTAVRPFAYDFGGVHLTDAQVVAAFRPLAALIAAQVKALPAGIDYKTSSPLAVALDRTPLAQYLDAAGVTGPLHDLLTVAYVTEYGLETGQQSSLNLVNLIGTDTGKGFQPFGASDERFTVVGGNRKVTDALFDRVADQIWPGRELVSLRARGRGFVLTFRTAAGPPVEVPADLVILALPFSVLRDVEMRVPLPAVKALAIRTLGYGTNAKVLLGFNARPWRAQGYGGYAFTDLPFQNCWDSSRLQPGPGGGLTVYTGGLTGLSVGEGTTEDQVRRFLPGVDALYPGAAAAYNGRSGRAYWPGNPFVRASYSSYTTGQTTSIGGAQAFPVGNLFFAGEHCDHPDLGYMNSGARTGRLAARAVADRVKV